MTTRTVRNLMLCALLLGACDSCGASKTVPFKRNQAVLAVDAGKPGPAPIAAEAPTVTTYADEPNNVQIGAGRITLPEHRIAASVRYDLSGDGLQDALLLSSDEAGAIRVHAFLGQESGGLQAAGAPLVLWQQPGCETSGLSLRVLSAAHLLVQALTRCEPPPRPALPDAEGDDAAGPQENRPDPYDLPPEPSAGRKPPVDQDQDPAAGELTDTSSRSWIVSLQTAPRKLESLQLPTREPDIEPALTGSFSGADVDGDGHLDVRLHLTVRLSEQDEGERIDVTWLNRPSGLGRDSTEPEATMLSLAKKARKQLQKAPGRAEKTARRVIALHDMLCHGGSDPKLTVGGTAGLPCGRSIARPRAVSILVAALAMQARLVEALAMHAQLHDSATQDLRKVDRLRAQEALAAFPGMEGYAIARGPMLAAHRSPPVHAPRLRFSTERHVTILAPARASYDIRTKTLSPMAGAAGNLMTSPNGRLAVTEIFRSCDGFHLRIIKASQVIAGIVVAGGGSVAEPLLLEAPPPPGATCPKLADAARRDDGDFSVLRWSGGGIVMLRHGKPSVLPMGDNGHATGPLEALSSAAPADLARHIPAPLRSHVPIVTKLGIALLDLNQDRATLLRTDSPAEATDVAVSASGLRIAFVRDGFLWIAQPAPIEPATPPKVKDAGSPGR